MCLDSFNANVLCKHLVANVVARSQMYGIKEKYINLTHTMYR